MKFYRVFLSAVFGLASRSFDRFSKISVSRRAWLSLEKTTRLKNSSCLEFLLTFSRGSMCAYHGGCSGVLLHAQGKRVRRAVSSARRGWLVSPSED